MLFIKLLSVLTVIDLYILYVKLFMLRLFVCFKVGMGTGACPGYPLCLMNVSVFTEDPKSREFPLHHYSGLGTRTVFLLQFDILNV